MSPPLRRSLEGVHDHGLDVIVGKPARCSEPRLVVEAVQPILKETAPPPADSLVGRSMGLSDGRVRLSVRAGQNQPCSKRETPVHAASIRQAHQSCALDLVDHKLDLGTPGDCHTSIDHRRRCFASILFQGLAGENKDPAGSCTDRSSHWAPQTPVLYGPLTIGPPV